MPSEFTRHIAARLVKIKQHRVCRATPYMEELRRSLEPLITDLNVELERRGVVGSASVETDADSHDFRVRLAVQDRIAFVDVCSQAEGRFFKLTGAVAIDLRVPVEGLAQTMPRNGGATVLLTSAGLAHRIVAALGTKCITG